MRDVLRKRKNKPMFFIDIAVPRDIDPDVNGLDNIYLYDIDDLKEVVEENLAGRREEAARASLIVAEETEVFCRWLKALELQPTIVDLIRRGESIARAELERSLRRIGPLPEETREALLTMVNSLVKKLHHEPIMFLKRRHAEEEDLGLRHIDLVRRIFNLDSGTPSLPSQRRRGCRGKPGH
jgi:glutamyl-tRNA reductase